MSNSSKLVLKSTTSTSLNDRFSKLMKNRPDDSSRSLVGQEGAVRPGSEKNRRFAEELERKSGTGSAKKFSKTRQEIRRKPLSTRLGDVGQGGARGFAQAIKRTPTKGGLAGRVGKRPGNDNVIANKALKRAQTMLRDTERELASLKTNKPISARISKPAVVRRGGGAGRGGRGGGRGGAGRGGNTNGGGRGGRGGAAGRGGAPGRGGKVTEDDLNKDMDAYMLKTKGGLDAQMDDYMGQSKDGVKSGLDNDMDAYMAAKSDK